MVSPGRSVVSGGIATPVCRAWYRSAASWLTSASVRVVRGPSALMISNLEQWSAGRTGGPGSRGWVPRAPGRSAGRSGGVHAELPQAVAVLGGPGGAVHPDVAAGAGDVERLVAAGAGRGGVDRGPVRPVGGRLDLERGRVSGLPVQHDLADGLARSQVDFEPLGVREAARPPGAEVAVGGRRG